MFPGMNPRAMKQAMKRLGMKQDDITAKEVIITTTDKIIKFTNPKVAKVNMMGQVSWQITGESIEQPLHLYNEEDVKTVMAQSNCDESTAKAVLNETNGDIAEAILKLQ